MSESFAQCSLFLHPKNSLQQDTHSLITALENTGLIANAINSHDKHYYAGDKFLEYIAYMGCAPNIQFEASDNNEKFCFIKILTYDKTKLIVSKTQAKPPQCPECKKPVKNWRDKITDTELYCDFCKTSTNIKNYNWRRMGGYAKLFIEITDIFPKEAIPQQSLLDKLSSISSTNWRYFYSCH